LRTAPENDKMSVLPTKHAVMQSDGTAEPMAAATRGSSGNCGTLEEYGAAF
jgi:hypothetical protein